MAKRSDDSPNEIAILPTKLQEDVQALLDEAGISESDIEDIMKAIENAELNKCERDWERHQEHLMECGPGPSLLEQQIAAREWDSYNRIRPIPGDAFAFWRQVAIDRGLDPSTVMSIGGDIDKTSALPWGHEKHWCWPSALKMQRRPAA